MVFRSGVGGCLCGALPRRPRIQRQRVMRRRRQLHVYWQDQPGLLITTGLNTGMAMAMLDMSDQVALCNRPAKGLGNEQPRSIVRRLTSIG